MNTTLCGLPRRRDRADEISRLLPVAVPRVHAVAEVEPGLPLAFPAVRGGAALEACFYGGVDEGHGAHGVAAEGDAGADFGEGRGGFVDVGWDAVVAETDGEGEAADSAAGDGDGEGVLGRGGGGHCVSGLGTLFGGVEGGCPSRVDVV